MTVLETKNLFKHFDGVRALNDLSLEIEAGKIIGLVGPNGSGKSTLINVLTGVFKSDGGMFVIDGLTLKKISPWEIRFFGLARTFQEVRLFNQMSVLDNLLFVLTERNVFASLFENPREARESMASSPELPLFLSKFPSFPVSSKMIF